MSERKSVDDNVGQASRKSKVESNISSTNLIELRIPGEQWSLAREGIGLRHGRERKKTKHSVGQNASPITSSHGLLTTRGDLLLQFSSRSEQIFWQEEAHCIPIRRYCLR